MQLRFARPTVMPCPRPYLTGCEGLCSLFQTQRGLAMEIDRAFIRIAEGQVHYRHVAAPGGTTALPLYLAHACPVSSASLESLLAALAGSRRLIAPDTLGYGDSARPAPDVPDLAYFADSVIRVLDALGIDQVDYYGTHTGAHIGCEVAIRHPDRIRRLIIDGMGLYEGETQEDFLAHYAPPQKPDAYGSQLNWAWHFLRDQSFFFPHFRKTAEHRLDQGVMPPDMLNAFTIDILKALETYHLGYHAVFRHDTRTRLALVRQPLFLMSQSWDPMKRDIDALHRAVPSARKRLFGADEGIDSVAAEIVGFLDTIEP